MNNIFLNKKAVTLDQLISNTRTIVHLSAR